ncbi:MAG: flippase-like domain-containing protein [Chloroflexi bacterium]|nr:flippase-like domain-containing protein [Chloroflexota bacterium]
MGTPQNGESPTSNTPDLALRRRFFSVPTLIGYTVAIAVLALAASRVFDIDWSETWRLVKSTNPWWYLLALVLYYVSFWFRGWRWNLIVKSAELDQEPGVKMPSIMTSSAIILMGWFANSVAFMRLGDAYRGYAFSKESGTRFSAVLGTVLGERVQDMFAVLVLLLIASVGLIFADTADAPIWVIIAALVLVGGLFTLLVIMRFFGHQLANRLPERFQSAYENFHTGALASFQPRHIPIQLGLGAIGWGLETARLYFVAEGMGIEVGITVALFAALANAMLTTIPTPGGFGFVEGGLTGVLILMGLGDTDAFALTVVDRTISWISIIIIGGLLFLLWQLFRGPGVGAAKFPQEDSSQTATPTSDEPTESG